MVGEPFEIGACLDLGAFDPSRPDRGVRAFLERADRVPDWVVLMEDRQPDFFHSCAAYEPGAPAPLNRHGPNGHRWTQEDLRGVVGALRDEGVAALLGFWAHECRWVRDRHPELLMRRSNGTVWEDPELLNSDFNPLKRLAGDADSGVRGGERYYEWASRRAVALMRGFGFSGVFLGDGGMGFRRHGIDWKDLRHLDFDDAWLAEFTADRAFAAHDGCALLRDGAPTKDRAADVRAFHWEAWVDWNTARWTGLYRHFASAVHDRGGVLGAYNVMNYDPALARLHGVDYRGIAEAGLDYLVFQTYDYAWGPLGPFGFLEIRRKDLETNLRSLLLARAHVGHATGTRILFTAETLDRVEEWDAPVAHTLGELYAYGSAASFDGERWRRAADGAFVVWGNAVAPAEWRRLGAAARSLEGTLPAPRSALTWAEGDDRRLLDRGLHLESPEDLYAHLETWDAVGGGAPGGVIRKEHLPLARWPARRTGPRSHERVRLVPRSG